MEGNNTHLKGLQRCVSVCVCVYVLIPGDKSMMSYQSPSLTHTHTHSKKCFSSSRGKQTFITGTFTCSLCKHRCDLCTHYTPTAEIPVGDPFWQTVTQNFYTFVSRKWEFWADMFDQVSALRGAHIRAAAWGAGGALADKIFWHQLIE